MSSRTLLTSPLSQSSCPSALVSESGGVEASAVQVETQTGTVQQHRDREQVRELPLNGRNFVSLTS